MPRCAHSQGISSGFKFAEDARWRTSKGDFLQIYIWPAQGERQGRTVTPVQRGGQAAADGDGAQGMAILDTFLDTVHGRT